jgi:hypothetical protein
VEALEDRTVPSLFNAPLLANLPEVPLAVATGHLRGPGAPLDAVTVNRFGTVSVLLGNGDGTFQAANNLRVDGTFNTYSLGVGDLLGNGVQDIVTSNGRAVQVLLGNGDGTFQAAQTVQTDPLGVGAVTLADFAGNGRQDILTVRASGSLSVLLSNGDGTFADPVETPVTGASRLWTNNRGVAVGDFAHDGRPGLALTVNGVVQLLRGNGDGTFSPEATVNVPASAVLAADLTGSGNLDLVAMDRQFSFSSERLSVLRGNGDGTFQAPVVLSEGTFNSVEDDAVGDFTGHGRMDIATLNYGSDPINSSAPNLDVWVNNGGSFQRLGPRPVGGTDFFLAAGDFRGRGTLDLLTTGTDSVTLFPNNGDGTFAFAPTFAAGLAPQTMAKADFTGSGRAQDLAVADPDGGVSVLLGNGDGTFRRPVPVSQSSGEFALEGLAVGDFLGNGRQDIAVGVTDFAFGGDSVLVILGNGDGTFQQTPVTLSVPGGFGTGAHSLVAADVNGDGRQDLLVASSSSVSVFLSNGDGTFAAPVTAPLGGTATDLAVADLRGQGTPDLVAAVRAAGGQAAVEVLSGNGDGTFQAPATVFTGTGGKLAVGDFLGAGQQDVVTYSRDGTLNLLPSNGDGTFGAAVTTSTGLGLSTVAVGDFAGDGHPGLAFTEAFIAGPAGGLASGNGGVIVLGGNGDGTFRLVGDYLTGLDQGNRSARGLVAGDFNGDGRLDLITTDLGPGGFGPGTLTVLLNQGGGRSGPPQAAAAAPTEVPFAANELLVAALTGGLSRDGRGHAPGEAFAAG